MDIEWARIVIIARALVASLQLLIYYRTKHDLAVIMHLSWIVNVIAYEIFKYVVRSDPAYYIASVIWLGVIIIQMLLFIIITYYYKTHPPLVEHRNKDDDSAVR